VTVTSFDAAGSPEWATRTTVLCSPAARSSKPCPCAIASMEYASTQYPQKMERESSMLHAPVHYIHPELFFLSLPREQPRSIVPASSGSGAEVRPGSL
jgi:hypothetical protein